jgi:SsrA-binding protein
MASKKDTPQTPRIVNRKARHDYHILDTLEVGIVLAGSEVKSARAGQVNFAGSYARVEPSDRQLYLYDVDIAPYAHAAGKTGHEPKHRRKLLAHRHQINKLLGQTADKGTTIVPLEMYFVRGYLKVLLGVAIGKKAYDKRQTVKRSDADRQIRRGMTRKVIG